jgi:ketosteroid isomerase-like protein
MSQENVELVRSLHERWNETGDLEEVIPYLDPSIEFEISWRSGRESADFQVLKGIEEVRTATEEIFAPFESVRYEVDEYRDAGDDVVAILAVFVRPKDSSAEISTGRFGYVYTLRGGKIVRVQDFPEPADALKAAGLSE